MERVLRERVRGCQRQVLMKWKGYLSDITNKGLPNRVLSKHLRFVWKEAEFERSV